MSCHHTPEQEAAWQAIDSTLVAYGEAYLAHKAAEAGDDDAVYAVTLGALMRAEAEFDGAWMHYHRI